MIGVRARGSKREGQGRETWSIVPKGNVTSRQAGQAGVAILCWP